MRINMDIFKVLSHGTKVILAAIAGPVFILCSNKELLATLLTKPLIEAVPEVLPALTASGALTGALYNMTPKKDALKE